MRNLTMMTDLYQLTMIYGYWKNDMSSNRAIFDLFYRPQGDVTSHAIVAGLEQAIEFVEELNFSKDDLNYLRSLRLFDEKFLAMLSSLKFTGDIDAMPEGSVVFPYEPIVRVHAPIIEAQFIETALLNIINHQTLIATKAARVCQAAKGDEVLEFGLRRAQGPDAGIYGARAAVIGGCHATSNVLAGKLFDIPIRGTHAHSWVMSFDSELESFRAYAEAFPSSCLLLVDTYNTLESGVPNAITVFNELREKGYEPVGIRLDSGDLSYLSKEARAMLDEAGFPKVKILASSDLDEKTIWDLKAQGAKIDAWGVGTKLITSHDNPSLGGVYKLVAQDIDGKVLPKIKISENPIKIINPGKKRVYRIYDKKTDKAIADLIALDDEKYDESKPLTIFDPVHTWKQMTITDYKMRDMLVPIYRQGRLLYKIPSLSQIQTYAKKEIASFWPEYMRLTRPQSYKVDLSRPLYDLRQLLLRENGYSPQNEE